MPSKFRNVTILLPAMDETYSLKETVDIIASTCDHEDLAEFIFLLCDRTTDESRKTTDKLVDDYSDSTVVLS